jgi:hypothetical protein
MTNPITPPLELVEQWRKEPEYTDLNKRLTMVTFTTDRLMQLCEKSAQHGADQQLKLDAEQITQAYQAGADQELEACCEWMVNSLSEDPQEVSQELRAARRPKPPTLKEQALDALREAESTGCLYVNGRSDLIRKALEALPND